ncbi:uncharacterized protein LOC144355742, partial [Saccoglossus kowalevskii]
YVSLSTFIKDRMKRDTEDVLSKYPWIPKKNCLPNFYLRSGKKSSSWAPDSLYRDRNSTTVFVHNQKSGGTTTKTCWTRILVANGYPVPVLASNLNAGDFYEDLLKYGSNQNLAHSYMGDSAFGICEFTHLSCSYFTVLRDPYDRIISSYNMCKDAKQPQCIVRNANRMSLKDWAMHQGSFFFRQLLTNPSFFTQTYSSLVGDLRGIKDPPNDKIPPWWRTELILRYWLSDEQKKILLEYILDHLQYWFAVIGLTDEYDYNFLMFQHVYQLSFHTKCSGLKQNTR